MKDVKKIVFDLLQDKLGLTSNQLTLDANFMKDLGLDSLDYIEVVMEFEQAFGIRIPDSDSMYIKTVGQVITYIENRLTKNTSQAA